MNNQAWLGTWTPNGDWTSRIPNYDSQYSATGHTDAQDCVEESLCHLIYCITGRRYSPRALAYLTQVTPNGSTFEQAIAAVNEYGLIPYELWATPDTFTWEEYYADIPTDVLARADKLPLTLVPFDLNISPGWTVLMFNPNASLPGPAHAVCQINATQYFDSETGAAIKPLNYEGAAINYQTSVVIGLPDHYTTETSDPVTVNTQTINV
jgi:hypothetical protein